MTEKTFKRVLCLVFAVLVLTSMACVVASANNGQKANYNITDIITSKEGTYTYYFYMPDAWKNQYNDTYVEGDESSYSAGIYWWEGTGNCKDNPNADGNDWPGYNVTEQVAPNVYVAHVPTDVTTIIWNNTVYGGTDNTLPEYTAAINSSNIPSEYFDPDDLTDTYKFFPEGTENFDGMIYVCDPEATEINPYSNKATYKGSWLYYYGDGKYGVQKTLEEAEAANAVYSNGEFPVYGFQIDAKELNVYTNATGTIKPNRYNCTATIADESIATITQDEVTGVVTVTPVKVGTTTVTFKYTVGTRVMTEKCIITVKEPPEVSPPEIFYETILLNESKTVNIPTKGDVRYYQFTPEYSGTYEIYSSGDYDTYGYLYDSNMNRLTYDDDGGSGNNFKINYNLTADTKYIIGAKFWSTSNTGSFTITVIVPSKSFGDFMYQILADGTAKIIDYSGSDTDIEIPSEIDGYTVTIIGDSAFLGCTSLKGVTIPNSVTSIGDYAFGYYYDEEYDENKIIDGFKITGYSDTEAERYANDNGCEFISLGEAPTQTTEPTEVTESIAPSETTEPTTEVTESTAPSETTEPTTETTENTNPTETESKPTETEPVECDHATTKTVGAKSATYFAKGNTGDKVCAVCGEVIEKGKSIAVKKLKTPKVTVKGAKKAIKVTYKKVKDAKGFTVTYKLGKKTYTKKFTLSKKELKKAKVTKTIKVKKSGKYKVTVKAFVTSGKKIAYSKPTKAVKVKIK